METQTKTAVQVKTQAQYNKLMKAYDGIGWKWSNGDLPLYFNLWRKGMKEKSICFKDKFCFAHTSYYKKRDYKIITTTEACKRIKKMKEKSRLSVKIAVKSYLEDKNTSEPLNTWDPKTMGIQVKEEPTLITLTKDTNLKGRFKLVSVNHTDTGDFAEIGDIYTHLNTGNDESEYIYCGRDDGEEDDYIKIGATFEVLEEEPKEEINDNEKEFNKGIDELLVRHISHIKNYNDTMLNKGTKHDQNKLRYDLLPADALEKIVEVLTHGAEKYGDNNWKELENFDDRYYAADMRHGEKKRQGEYRDKDSGLLHSAHKATGAIFQLWKDIQDKR